MSHRHITELSASGNERETSASTIAFMRAKKMTRETLRREGMPGLGIRQRLGNSTMTVLISELFMQVNQLAFWVLP